MGNLDSILKGHAKRLGIENQVEAVGVVERATEVISQYIPREDFEVISFKDGALKVGAKNAAVSSEILLRTKEIANILGPDVVKINTAKLPS